MKKALLILMAVIMVLSLTGCFIKTDFEPAKKHAEGFFSAVRAEDYGQAQGFLHPECELDPEEFFKNAAKEYGLDFATFAINGYTNVSVNTSVGLRSATTYTFVMDTSVSGKQVTVQLVILEDSAGFGIYDAAFDMTIS